MDLSNYSKANRAKIEKEAGLRFRCDQLPPCSCGGPAMGTEHAPDCRWELAAEDQMETRYEEAVRDLTEAGEIHETDQHRLVPVPSDPVGEAKAVAASRIATAITVQKIARKHGDGSLNYDVSICDGRPCVQVACATEEDADELIDALDRLAMDTQVIDDVEAGC